MCYLKPWEKLIYPKENIHRPRNSLEEKQAPKKKIRIKRQRTKYCLIDRGNHRIIVIEAFVKRNVSKRWQSTLQ